MARNFSPPVTGVVVSKQFSVQLHRGNRTDSGAGAWEASSCECLTETDLRGGEVRRFWRVSPSSQVLLIFQALEAILLRTASDLSHLHVVGTNIVKKLLNNHMKLICEALYASGYR